jgi:hypothetical protein
MAKKLPQRVGREICGDGRGAEFDSLSSRGDAPAEFIVVRQSSPATLRSRQWLRGRDGERQRRAKSEVQSSLEQSCAQNSGHKIGADAQCLEARAESGAGDAAVEAGHQSDRGVGKRRDHLAQIIRGNANVAVIYQQDFVARRRQHLRQIADLDIRSQHPIAHDQLNPWLGYFA